jgi:hypothetical protein
VVTVRAAATGFVVGTANVVVTDNEAASNLRVGGRVTLASSTTTGVAGVLMTLRTGTTICDTVTTDSAGNYKFIGLPRGTYTLTPTAIGYSFTPTSRTIVLPRPATETGAPSALATHFSATPRTTITGFTPAFGAVGSTVSINGIHFLRTSSVKFGSVAARFTIVSNTSLRAVVPVGATTGRITVTAPTGVAQTATSFVMKNTTTVPTARDDEPESISSNENLALPISPVRLSSGSALADESVIRLAFTGALDADSATQAAGYSVSVNGLPVEMESIGYKAHVVTLSLPPNTFSQGQSVRITWHDILDTNQKAVSGETRLIAH